MTKADRQWHAIDNLKRAHEKPVRVVILKLFEDQRREVVAGIRAQGTQKTTPLIHGNSVFDLVKWVRETLRSISAPMVSSLIAGFNAAMINIGVEGTFITDDPIVASTIQAINAKAKNIPFTTLDKINGAIQAGMENDETVNQIAARVGAMMDAEKVWRSKLIAQTVTTGAFEGGQLAAFDQAGIARKGWLTQRDGAERDEHGFADGQEVGVSEAFVVGGEALRFPGDPFGSAGNVINCFVAETEVVTGELIGAIRSSYHGQLVTIQTERGYKLTGTPNHPIFTPSGLVPLGILNKGSTIISSRFSQGVSGSNLDVQDKPVPIEKVYNALSEIGMSVGMGGVVVNLYGRVPKGKVDVVRAHGQLRGALNSSVGHPSQQLRFALSHLGHRLLFGECLFDSKVTEEGPILAPYRFVCSDNESLSFSGRGLVHPELLGCPAPPNSDALLDQSPAYNRSAYAEAFSNPILRLSTSISGSDKLTVNRMSSPNDQIDTSQMQTVVDGVASTAVGFGDLLDCFSGVVSSDNIVDVSVRNNFSGHVYTLHTGEGLYMANGIVVSNCRCSMLPIIE